MSQRNPKKRPQSNKARDYKQHFDDIIKRKTGTIDLATRILIVCEDGKSAINYFKALKRLMGLSAVSPVVKPNKDGQTQPEQVVAHARQLMAQALDSGTEPFDLVWCVIDGDFGPKVTRCRPTADSSHISGCCCIIKITARPLTGVGTSCPSSKKLSLAMRRGALTSRRPSGTCWMPMSGPGD